jgi:hypothetical protein
LPGREHADLAYNRVLAALQEIDACLEYVHLLNSYAAEPGRRRQFLTVLGNFPADARAKLEALAQQFDDPPGRRDPVHWRPDATASWDQSPQDVALPAAGSEAGRFVVIARCLDQIAATAEQISLIACEINSRSSDGSRHARERFARPPTGVAGEES